MKTNYKFIVLGLALVSVFIVSCKGKSKRLPQTDVEIVENITKQWNRNINSRNLDSLNILYDNVIYYYGKDIDKYKALDMKLASLKKHSDFKQIISNIEAVKIDDDNYKMIFDKQVFYSTMNINVQGQLLINKQDEKWLIISESDDVTEAKIAKEQTETNEESSSTIKTLEFEQKVTLIGVLDTISYSDFGDNEYTVFIVTLNEPINVNTPNKNYDAQKNVQEIQVGFKDNNGAKNYIGKTIKVTGEIYGEETVHDHRPVVMIHAIIQK